VDQFYKIQFPYCHVEQARTNPAQRESEGASKHPEDESFAMPRQGISTKPLPDDSLGVARNGKMERGKLL
jgi:hypothetical protein